MIHRMLTSFSLNSKVSNTSKSLPTKFSADTKSNISLGLRWSYLASFACNVVNPGILD